LVREQLEHKVIKSLVCDDKKAYRDPNNPEFFSRRILYPSVGAVGVKPPTSKVLLIGYLAIDGLA
jgi:hypothetical protein